MFDVGPVHVDAQALAAFLNGPDGPAARDGRRRAERINQGAKRRCPTSPEGSGEHSSGWLRSRIRVDEGVDAVGRYWDIGAFGVDYGLFVEVGTKPHQITSHGDYPLRDRKGNVFGRTVNHPGTTAQPYLRPALFETDGR